MHAVSFRLWYFHVHVNVSEFKIGVQPIRRLWHSTKLWLAPRTINLPISTVKYPNLSLKAWKFRKGQITITSLRLNIAIHPRGPRTKSLRHLKKARIVAIKSLSVKQKLRLILEIYNWKKNRMGKLTSFKIKKAQHLKLKTQVKLILRRHLMSVLRFQLSMYKMLRKMRVLLIMLILILWTTRSICR